MSRKIRYSILLPIVQVAITLMLKSGVEQPNLMLRMHLYSWQLYSFLLRARLIWRGVNAPTAPLSFFVGLGPGALLYLIATTGMWYLVGRFFDQRRGIGVFNNPRIGRRKIVIASIVMAWGIFILFTGLALIFEDEPGAFHQSNLIAGALFVPWSLILFAFSGLTIARAIGIRARVSSL